MKQLELDFEGQKTPETTLNSSIAPVYLRQTPITDSLPKSSGWELLIGGEHGIRIDPGEGKLPCWFHRKMQELLLGFQWRKK